MSLFYLDYIRHENNFSSIPEVGILLDKHGPTGYGMFWLLMEVLAASQNGVIKVSDSTSKSILARKLMLQGESELMGFLADLAGWGLIDRFMFEEKCEIVSRVTADSYETLEKHRRNRLGKNKDGGDNAEQSR